MKLRTILSLWSIAFALAIAIFVIKSTQNGHNQKATDRSPGEKLLAHFPADQVATIEITDSKKSVLLTQQNNKWVVAQRDDYPATTRDINQLLRTLTQLKVTQSIEAGPSFASHFGMDGESTDPATHGVDATFKDTSGNELLKISLGKYLEAASTTSALGGGVVGRYIRNHADDSGFYAVGEALGTLSPSPQDWLSTEFLQIEKIQTISVTKPGSDEIEWTITRDEESEELLFSDTFPGLKTNLSAVNALKLLYTYSHFEDVLTGAEAAKIQPNDQLIKATITTFEGFIYNLTVQPESTDSDNFLMNVAVSAKLPEKRKKAESESKKQAAEADEIFAKRHNLLSERLRQTKEFEGKTFLISRSTAAPLLKNRMDLTEPAQTPVPQQQTPVPQQPLNR
ncbi:DUF4340 domain-containing protein [Luteolibacter sp. AS25]|uniref:DUF4340 domain-containing protein n=1 Tax=Luteolibacter sp. AS25 TaxID=3135776 RepID=UPI00398A5A10